MKYDDEVHLNKDARGDFVFSWLRNDGKPPIRVQVRRTHVADHWGKDWQHGDSVKDEFRRRRMEWIKQAEASAVVDETGALVFDVH